MFFYFQIKDIFLSSPWRGVGSGWGKGGMGATPGSRDNKEAWEFFRAVRACFPFQLHPIPSPSQSTPTLPFAPLSPRQTPKSRTSPPHPGCSAGLKPVLFWGRRGGGGAGCPGVWPGLGHTVTSSCPCIWHCAHIQDSQDKQQAKLFVKPLWCTWTGGVIKIRKQNNKNKQKQINNQEVSIQTAAHKKEVHNNSNFLMCRQLLWGNCLLSVWFRLYFQNSKANVVFFSFFNSKDEEIIYIYIYIVLFFPGRHLQLSIKMLQLLIRSSIEHTKQLQWKEQSCLNIIRIMIIRIIIIIYYRINLFL